MAENTLTTADALMRQAYGSKLENLVPDETSLAKDIDFAEKKAQPGNYFNQPVRLSRSHGWTISAAGSAYTLNSAEPCITDNAKVRGTSFTGRETIAYDVLTHLKPGDTKGFKDAVGFSVESLYESAAFVREISLMWGAKDIGVTTGQTADNGTSQTFQFAATEFIPALWAGLENGYVDCYDTTEATQRNSTGTIQVTSVDIANRKITVLGTEAELDAIVATDKFFLRGCKSAGMVGCYGIFSNTGTLHEVPGATYSLFTGNTYAASSAQMVFQTVLHATNLPANRGFRGKLTAYVAPPTWNDANNDLAALRRYGEKKGGKVDQGAEGIEYHTHFGSIILKPYLYMKPSVAVVVPTAKVKRIGTTDITFKIPGSNDKFFSQLEDSAGVQIRVHWNQAPFSAYPCNGLVVTGLVNSDQ